VSEYQYYEFLALDRPLTDAEYNQVRALSTRAQINRTRFVNEYQWGDFRGNPSVLMDQYYDAHLYFANWGTRILMLRLPATLLDLKTAERYCDSDTASVRRSGKNVVLEWRSDDEDGEEDWESGGPGSLAALVGVRAELAAGDLRPLYLAWLASVSAGRDEWSDDEEDGDDAAPDADSKNADRLVDPPPATWPGQVDRSPKRPGRLPPGRSGFVGRGCNRHPGYHVRCRRWRGRRLLDQKSDGQAEGPGVAPLAG